MLCDSLRLFQIFEDVGPLGIFTWYRFLELFSDSSGFLSKLFIRPRMYSSLFSFFFLFIFFPLSLFLSFLYFFSFLFFLSLFLSFLLSFFLVMEIFKILGVVEHFLWNHCGSLRLLKRFFKNNFGFVRNLEKLENTWGLYPRNFSTDYFGSSGRVFAQIRHHFLGLFDLP